MKTMIKLNTVEKVKTFVDHATKYSGQIDLVSGKYVVDAKSIMGVFSLDLSKPIELVSSEKEITQELAELIDNFKV